MAEIDEPEVISDDEPATLPVYEQLVYQIRELRKESGKARYLQEDQIAGLMAEVGQLSSLVRESEVARSQDARATRAAIGDLAEGQGRILAELAARARQESLHEEAIAGIHKTVAATRADLALTRAKWLGWRGLAVSLGLGLIEAIKYWLGGR